MTSGVSRPSWLKKRPPADDAEVGWSRSRNQWTTSMKWVARSVVCPPAESQKFRQARKR